jgi:hypothetical protein
MHHTALRLIAELPKAFSQLDLQELNNFCTSTLRGTKAIGRACSLYFLAHLPHEVMSRKSVEVVDGKLQVAIAQLLKSDAETIFIAVDVNAGIDCKVNSPKDEGFVEDGVQVFAVHFGLEFPFAVGK